jgi:uracil-DNA glycosylase family 4
MRALFPNNAFVDPQLPNPSRDLTRFLIGEAPGLEESEKGIPFVGGSGRVLDRLLRGAGIDREGLTITNCLSCRPPGNVFPTDRNNYISKIDAEISVKHCVRNHVLPLLKSRQWARIDIVGEKALRWIGGKFGIAKWRGSPITIDTDDIERRTS